MFVMDWNLARYVRKSYFKQKCKKWILFNNLIAWALEASRSKKKLPYPIKATCLKSVQILDVTTACNIIEIKLFSHIYFVFNSYRQRQTMVYVWSLSTCNKRSSGISYQTWSWWGIEGKGILFILKFSMLYRLYFWVNLYEHIDAWRL